MKENPVHPAAGKAVVYVRLSGQPYGYDPFSPDNQRRICRDHALREHIEIVAEYQDLTISGRKDAWEGLSLVRRRAVLAEAVREVWVFSADVPVARRVRIVWVGEDPPTPRDRQQAAGFT